MQKLPLPIDPFLPEILAQLSRHGSVVLTAETGSGKTTRLPAALLDAQDIFATGSVLMLEPRRLAARAAANWIAKQRGETVGDVVGYEVRFDRRTSPQTKLKIVTDGIALRMLQRDPFLDGISVVVFDEFHERSLDLDLAFAMVRKIQNEVRSDLKIVVMSATIESAPVAHFLGGAPVIACPGKSFPVEISYRGHIPDVPIPDQVAVEVAKLIRITTGDILVFLPGVGEIQRTFARLQGLAGERGIVIAKLYGDMPLEEQDRAIAPASHQKIVLATNVAETSLTIEGITAVLDCGFARVMRHDASVGLDRLTLKRISKASAQQRSGRAGRLGPGICWRMWSETEQRRLQEFDEPAIKRVELSSAALQLYAWGEADLASFAWFERPADGALQNAEAQLELLNATTEKTLTAIGAQMARLPIAPRLARLLLEASHLDCLDQAALAAAFLSEKDPFEREVQNNGSPSSVDLLARLRALREFEQHGRTISPAGRLHSGVAKNLLRVRDQLVRSTKAQHWEKSAESLHWEAALEMAFLAAFPDRFAKRRSPESALAVMVGGIGVRLPSEHALEGAERFLCLDVDIGGAYRKATFQGKEHRVRLALDVSRAELPADKLKTKVELEFDPERKRVFALKRVRFLDLTLEEAPTSIQDEAEAASILARAAADDLQASLPLEEKPVANYLEKVRWLGNALPPLGLPKFNREDLRPIIEQLCIGRKSFAELKQAPVLDFLKAALTSDQRFRLEKEAPERFTMPNGQSLVIRYQGDQTPVLAGRIQQFFGLKETPRIAGGRVKLLLHLLAPNMRPQQVTDDLESFWENIYPKIRKELRQRYPRHKWPEDGRVLPDK